MQDTEPKDQFFYSLFAKYSLSTLYLCSGNLLSVDRSNASEEILSREVTPDEKVVLGEFLSPAGLVLLPDIWKVKLDMYGTGNQSTKHCEVAIEVLRNEDSVAFSDYKLIPFETVDSMEIEVYIPSVTYSDRVTLRVWAWNTHTNNGGGNVNANKNNTFYLYINQNHAYMKK